MSRYKTLLVNIFLFTLNTVSTKLITFFLVPLYTFFLTTTEYGVTDMSLTISSLITPVLTLSIGDAVTRFIIDDEANTDRYATLGFWITLLGCFVSALLLPTLDLPIFGGLGNYKFFYIIYFTTSAFTSYLANVARGLNQIRLITWVSIVSSLTTAGMAGLLIGILHMKVNGYFMSLIIGGILSILLYMSVGKSYRYIRLPHTQQDKKLLSKLLLYSVPLIPNSIFWWIGTSVNRFFITGMLGIGASGLFAAASKIPNVMNMISSTFWQAWSLSTFQEFRKANVATFYSNVFTVFRNLCFIIASALILLAPWLASILLQKEFYLAWPVIPILILGFLFNVFAGFYGTVFTASMKTKYLMTTTLIAALTVILFTGLLIPKLGLKGAATAMVVSNLVMFIARVISAKKILDFNIKWAAMIFNSLFVVLQSIIMSMQIIHYMEISFVIFIIIIIISVIDLLPITRNILTIFKNRIH